MDAYSLTEYDLFKLHDYIISYLGDQGITVTLRNLEEVVETEVYRVTETRTSQEKHHESCISDGLEVYLHNDLEEVGGICSRVYDLLHVGCGHVWQWSANSKSGLRFYGSEAWRIASIFFLGKTDREINLVREYEKEAGILAISNLEIVLQQSDFRPEFRESCRKFLNDYVQNDLEYIIDYYRTGEVKNFFNGWKFELPELAPVDVSFTIDPVRRSNKCVSLISLR